MTKSELVEQMAKDAGISKAAANAALNSFITGITNALKKEGRKGHSGRIRHILESPPKSPQRPESRHRRANQDQGIQRR